MGNFPWRAFVIGNHRITCPECARGLRDKTCGVTIEPGGAGVAHCFRCNFTASTRPANNAYFSTPGKPPNKTAATRAHNTLADFGLELWSACMPISGAALSYLRARSCRIPPTDGDLRWHSSLQHPSGHVGAALVALVTDAVTGEPLTLHKTWIRADGDKAHVVPPRLLLAGHRKQGGVVRLWPDEAVTHGLAVAEGIETALSLAWAFLPVWAAIDAGNLKALPVLRAVAALTVAADDDDAGRTAAEACAQRWAGAGNEVTVTGLQ